MLQRHILYVANTKIYVAKTNFICCKDNIMRRGAKKYMLQRHIVHVAKTYIICCKDKKHGARAERARRGLFRPKRDILIL